MDIMVGDIVRLRKKHPCGNDEWEVLKTGIDIRIKCLGCQRQLVLERIILEHKIKTLISRSNPVSNSDEAKISGSK